MGLVGILKGIGNGNVIWFCNYNYITVIMNIIKIVTEQKREKVSIKSRLSFISILFWGIGNLRQFTIPPSNLIYSIANVFVVYIKFHYLQFQYL